jgi:quinohemoprotein ethanol dehydrogenase
MWRLRGLCLAVGLAAAALAGCSGERPANVTGERMRAADSEAGNWLSAGRTWGEQRFSPLNQINTENVNRLGLAWFVDLDTDRGVEATPLVVDGVLYNITPWNITTAYDATTGEQLWRFDPEVPRRFGGLACCDIVTRGLAAWSGKIYIATLDGRLIALDARNGRQLWSVQTLEEVWPYTITGAPRVYDGKVIIGNAGAEGAARGYVSAYDAETGERAWRFYTVPGNPADGFASEAEEMAAHTWSGEWWERGGGGTAWDSFAYDPELELLYIGTGNGGPWSQVYRSPGGGDNLFISSIVAVNVHTGEYAWHYQETPGEEWDYTSTQSIILADLEIDGRQRQTLLHAPKNGFFYVLDRSNGQLISAEPFVQTTWASRIDLASGRPVENPAARYGERPALVRPGAAGGHNWHPMAFSPQTGLVYFPVLDSAMIYSVNPDFVPEPGHMHQLGIATTGYDAERQRMNEEIRRTTRSWLVAWDPVAQREVWRQPHTRRGSGGVLATAGDLVFEGTIDQTFAAFNARTGEKLWEVPAQQVPIAAAMTYEVDGVQYVAVNAGWGGGIAHGPAARDYQMRLSRSARLLVYRLDGEAELPPLPEENWQTTRVNQPPPSTGTPAQIARGETLYAQICSGCHGAEARGGIKDLRMMSPETRAEFNAIVLEGVREERGMVSFADRLSPADAEAIHAYLIHRANADWNGGEVR